MHDAVEHSDDESGNFVHVKNEKRAHFSENVLVLMDNATSIKSETDLEKYVNDPAHTESISVFADPETQEILAVWNVSQEAWDNFSDDPYASFPQIVKDVFGYREI